MTAFNYFDGFRKSHVEKWIFKILLNQSCFRGIVERIEGTSVSSHETSSLHVETLTSSEYSSTVTSQMSRPGDSKYSNFRFTKLK